MVPLCLCRKVMCRSAATAKWNKFTTGQLTFPFLCLWCVQKVQRIEGASQISGVGWASTFWSCWDEQILILISSWGYQCNEFILWIKTGRSFAAGDQTQVTQLAHISRAPISMFLGKSFKWVRQKRVSMQGQLCGEKKIILLSLTEAFVGWGWAQSLLWLEHTHGLPVVKAQMMIWYFQGS